MQQQEQSLIGTKIRARGILRPIEERVRIQQIYPGNLHLTKVPRSLVEDLEQALGLDQDKKRMVLVNSSLLNTRSRHIVLRD